MECSLRRRFNSFWKIYFNNLHTFWSWMSSRPLHWSLHSSGNRLWKAPVDPCWRMEALGSLWSWCWSSAVVLVSFAELSLQW